MHQKIAIAVNVIVMVWWAIYLPYRILCFPQAYAPLQIVDIATIAAGAISSMVAEKVCKHDSWWPVIRLVLFLVPIGFIFLKEG